MQVNNSLFIHCVNRGNCNGIRIWREVCHYLSHSAQILDFACGQYMDYRRLKKVISLHAWAKDVSYFV